jgi:dTDP-4-dehydrorhamnose reductase
MVTGAGGLIGHALVQGAVRWASGWTVHGLTRARMDLADAEAVRRTWREIAPSLLIHCAALSRTPDCQRDPALARRLNVEATARLADLARDAYLVFFSTDLVFDGKAGWYREEDPVNPVNVYAETKVEAERLLADHPRALIIRPALVGGISPTGDRGFNEALRRDWEAGRTVTLFTDEFRTPTPAPILARALWDLIAAGATGVYHVAGVECLSRYEIGKALAARWPTLDAKIAAGSRCDFRGVPRPADTSLHTDKLRARLDWRLPGLTEWLAANPDEPF